VSGVQGGISIVAYAPSNLERRTRVRFSIISFVFLVTSINYADRATFSIAGNAAAAELGLSTIATGYILSAFAWAYTLAQVPGGALLDRFGTKRIYVAAIALWSLFTFLQGSCCSVCAF
jgi:MFS transporter, ACS family, glucarate transporter